LSRSRAPLARAAFDSSWARDFTTSGRAPAAIGRRAELLRASVKERRHCIARDAGAWGGTFMAESGPNWLVVLAMLITPLQIVLVDLLLSADNAVVIALACRGLPEEDSRVAAFFGTAGAVVLRLAMAAAVVVLLHVPFLKLVAALALLGVAIKLTLSADNEPGANFLADAGSEETRLSSLLRSVATIIAADAVMSLDNVVAVATLANGNLFLLGFGLALSIPLLIWCSALIRRFLDENPLLVMFSGMYLGWLAGGIGISDPAVAPWIATNAPALPFVVPLACAIFVLWQTLILNSDRFARSREDA
jgi:YjbE family integral membrane protein